MLLGSVGNSLLGCFEFDFWRWLWCVSKTSNPPDLSQYPDGSNQCPSAQCQIMGIVYSQISRNIFMFNISPKDRGVIMLENFQQPDWPGEPGRSRYLPGCGCGRKASRSGGRRPWNIHVMWIITLSVGERHVSLPGVLQWAWCRYSSSLLITNPGNISDYGNVQWITADNKLHILLG